MLDCFKTAEQCAADLDTALDNLVFSTGKSFKPRTCFCCDCLLLQKEENKSVYGIKRIAKNIDLFKLQDTNAYMSDYSTVTIPEDVLQYYKYDVDGQYTWLQECVLSPNSCYCHKRNGFLVCKQCYNSLSHNNYPEYGLKNGYMIGTAPDIFDILSDEELSCISLVRNTAHIFTYVGGQETTIKGWHSMLEVDVSNVSRTLNGMNHTKLGFPDSITIVLEGPMTHAQYKKLRKKANASRTNMLRVLKWLINNNHLYAAHFESIPNYNDIPAPHIIERVKIVDSVDTNIELTEEMSMVFPDECLDETTGGFNSSEEFKQVISEINKGNTTATLTTRASNYVYANCDNNFVKAFPRQYPYGIGGPNEIRLNSEDEPRKVKFVDYLQHVNNLSNVNFHTQAFSIITWNILEKCEMINRACFKIKPDSVLQKKISETKSDTMRKYISALLNGEVLSDDHGNEEAFLEAVNSITYKLPHSNADAYANRKKAFSMQLRFGFPFVFFTVAPDDSSSYAVSVYTGLQFDPNDKLEDLNENEIIHRAKKRHDFRIRYAGVGALWYHAVMNAIWKHVIGWDWTTKTGSPGLYGIPEAAMESTEEQTRKRLHAHCLVWIKGASQLLEDLQCGDEDKALSAREQVIQILERSSSVSLMDKATLPNRIFHHGSPCTSTCKQSRKKPSGVSAQQLRDMRHKIGKTEHKGVIASCSNCNEKYSVEKLLCTCLKYWNSEITSHEFEVDCWSYVNSSPEEQEQLLTVTGKKKMEELLFLLSIPNKQRHPTLCKILTNAVRNLHSDRHATQCYKKGVECRYRLPALPMIATIINSLGGFYEWYDYLGQKSSYQLFELVIRRSEYDVFQNQSCTAISLSKLGSNSNSQLCINGQKVMYVTKYPTKSTQEEDESDYEKLLHFICLRLGDELFQNHCSEALSRAIGACLAHSSSNIISAWLAKHLIHQRSRFRFSHEFRMVPSSSAQDELMGGNSRWRKLKSYNGTYYVDSTALQYLHRPNKLQSLSLMDFVLNYHVARKSKNNQDEMIHYDCNNDYQAAEYQGILVSKSNTEYIPGINVWAFVDAADFGGLLLDEKAEITTDMEDYALEVLTCFCPFRTHDDLLHNCSYVKKFRLWYAELQNDPIQFEYVHRVLTNIQHFNNSLRIKSKEDILCDSTEAFVDPDADSRKRKNSKYDQDTTKAQYEEDALQFIASIVQKEAIDNTIPQFTHNAPLSLIELQKKGSWKCGFHNIPSMNPEAALFNIYSDETSFSVNSPPNSDEPDEAIYGKVTKCDIVHVMLQRTIRQHSSQLSDSSSNPQEGESTNRHGISLSDIDATGTPESIHSWAKYAFNGDVEQQRAFEILASKFVLTYITEADGTDEGNNTLSGTARHEYIRCKQLLQEMVGKPAKTGQLIMFLTGPGGSGKSRIIHELLRYGQQFCSNIEQPFTRNTILVTACSGVAATLIHGQTLHSAIHLNKKIRNIDIGEKGRFQNSVKMLIIDEISLLGGSDIKDISKHLNWLMENRSGVYGGLDIAFLGDFRQLTPVGKKPIYETKSPEFRSYVNCYISLKGQYRFKDDPEFGKICQRFHEGHPTISDFISVNNRLVTPSNPLPKNVRVACKRNDEREAINVATWLQYLQEHGEDKGFVILADNVHVRRDGSPNQRLRNLASFYSKVGEDDCNTHMEGNFTPMLRCYPHCPLMLTTNTDVGNNLANGTQGNCVGVVLQPGNQFHSRHIDNLNVKCIYASQVKCLLWKVQNKTVEIAPRQYTTLRANFPSSDVLQDTFDQRITVHLKATQIPLISNNATTGHKLQGTSVDNLYIPSWNYSVNWPYVALSRVTTLAGLYLGRPLLSNKIFTIPEALTRMLWTFNIRVSPDDFDYRKLNINM